VRSSRCDAHRSPLDHLDNLDDLDHL
jgi:hypothetical protein